MIGALLQLFVLREINRVCGIEAFGAFVFAGVVSRYLMLADVNFFEGAQREFARTFGNGDEEGGFVAVRTLLTATFFTACLLMVLHLGAGHLVSFGPMVATGSLGFMTIVGIYGILFQAYFALNSYFASRSKFNELALLSLGFSVLTSVLGLAGLYVGRTIDAYVVGMSSAVFLVVATALLLIERDRRLARVRPSMDWTQFWEFGKLGLRSFPNRLSSIISSANDQLAVELKLGRGSLGQYNQASRLPVSASEALPILQVVGPTINEAYFKGPAEFGRVIQRYSLLALVCGLAFVVLPSAFAIPFLTVWLGRDFVEPMQWVLIGFALYGAFDMFFSTIGRAMYSQGEPEKIFPFMIYNSATMLLLAVPAVSWFGLLGAVGLKVFIHVTQFFPILLYARKVLKADLNVRLWAIGVGQMLFPCAGLVVAVYAFTSLPWCRANPLMALLPGPIVVWVYLWVVQKSGKVDLPEPLVRRLRLS